MKYQTQLSMASFLVKQAMAAKLQEMIHGDSSPRHDAFARAAGGAAGAATGGFGGIVAGLAALTSQGQGVAKKLMTANPRLDDPNKLRLAVMEAVAKRTASKLPAYLAVGALGGATLGGYAGQGTGHLLNKWWQEGK